MFGSDKTKFLSNASSSSLDFSECDCRYSLALPPRHKNVPIHAAMMDPTTILGTLSLEEGGRGVGAAWLCSGLGKARTVCLTRGLRGAPNRREVLMVNDLRELACQLTRKWGNLKFCRINE